MKPGLRKFTLTIHLGFSVGWIGAVVAYLALVLTAMSLGEPVYVRSTWIALDVIGRYAIVPLAWGSLVTGLIISLGTSWGLFRHYWVLISLVLTVFAIYILVPHMHSVKSLAAAAAETSEADLAGIPAHAEADHAHADAAHLAGRLVAALEGELLHAGVGLLVLLAVQVLNVYKPRGLTPYGWRKRAGRTEPEKSPVEV